MTPAAAMTSGFADPGTASQSVFRTVLAAIARPGCILPMRPGAVPPAPLLATAAEIMLAMADFETAIWLDAPLAASGEVAAYLRFHTGAKIVTDPAAATFALMADPAGAPPMSAFAQGVADYPDRSTTLIVQCGDLAAAGPAFEGPGINGRVMLRTEPGLPDVAAQLAQNRAAFPCGVDLVFVTASAIAALPRSVRLVKG